MKNFNFLFPKQNQGHLLKDIYIEYDFNDISEEALCDLISDDGFNTQWNKWNNLDKNEIKFLKKFGRKVNITQVERGVTVQSAFCNILINRVEKQEISNDIRFDDMFINPMNIKFLNSIDELYSIIADSSSFENKANFSITTKHKNDPPFCDDCNGIGLTKCVKCKGSGREKFASSYFASGEPKKIDDCKGCQGVGKTKCPKCKGTGKMILPSENYQLIRYISDKYDLRSVCIENSLGHRSLIKSEYEELDSNDYNYMSPVLWSNMSQDELSKCVFKLNENENSRIVEKNLKDIGFSSKIEEEAFRDNLNAYERHSREYKKSEILVGIMNKNVSIPTIKLKYEIGQSSYDLLFFKTYKDEHTPIIQIYTEYLPELSSWQLLF